jgi:hypothetical protein
MGISDEDYGTALIELQQLKALSAKQTEDIVNAVDKYATGWSDPRATITLSTTGTSNVSMTSSGSKVLNEQDLQHDAMKAPLSALTDMWVVRFGGEWVSEADFQEDDFWRLALIRLVGANKLEKHHLASQYAAVYRIIE